MFIPVAVKGASVGSKDGGFVVDTVGSNVGVNDGCKVGEWVEAELEFEAEDKSGM